MDNQTLPLIGGVTSNHAIDWTPDQRCWSVPVALRASVAGHRERWAAWLVATGQERKVVLSNSLP